MNVSAAASASVQPPLPGLDVGLATYQLTSSGPKVAHEVKDPKVAGRTFATFEDAVGGAREILVPEYKAARWGLFNRKAGPVDAIALLRTDDGRIRLARTDVRVDPFQKVVPGAFYPGQSWWGPILQTAQRMEDTTLALVGAKRIVDLRSGDVVIMPPSDQG